MNIRDFMLTLKKKKAIVPTPNFSMVVYSKIIGYHIVCQYVRFYLRKFTKFHNGEYSIWPGSLDIYFYIWFLL